MQFPQRLTMQSMKFSLRHCETFFFLPVGALESLRAAKGLPRKSHSCAMGFESRCLAGRSLCFQCPQFPTALRHEISNVVHERKLWTHSASKKTHIRKENIVAVSGPVTEPPSKMCRSVRQPSMIPPQNENTATSKQVRLEDIGWVIAGSPLSPDVYSARIATQTKSDLSFPV